MLAHYLARYDGRYADILLNGDIHQVNADKIGISRKLVKTVTMLFYMEQVIKKLDCYDSSLSTSRAKSKGKEIRAAYVEAIPGLDSLLTAVKAAGDRGFVKVMDGRRVPLDSPHSPQLLTPRLSSTGETVAGLKSTNSKRNTIMLLSTGVGMMNYSLSAILNMQKIYQHPWYARCSGRRVLQAQNPNRSRSQNRNNR